MKLKASLLSIVLMATSLHASADWTDYVNPLVGTDNHGHVFVGASVPFGAVQVGPNHVGEGWDWCSGYNYTDPYLRCFAMLHLSGTGCADLGDICLMPVVGDTHMLRADSDHPEAGFASRYSHERETAQPGYYAVDLERYNIHAEMTSTERVGLFRFAYPKGSDARIVFDMENAISDRCVNGGLRRVDDHTVTGFRISRGWAPRHYIYFAARFSRPMRKWQAQVRDTVVSSNPLISKQAFGQAFFDVSKESELMVKVAVSGVSEENAIMNLEQELAGWDFEGTRCKARAAWNDALGRVDATFATPRERTAFYTALYHTMIAPQLFCDTNGDYRGSDTLVYRNANFKNYTTLSLWDTYRSYHPLATIIYPERQHDWLQTILHINREQGYLPIWHLMASETQCMVGISSVPVLADMYMKGFMNDTEAVEAYDAMTRTMARPWRDLEKFNKYGYIPTNMAVEDVAKSLEYGLNYWALAQMSKRLDKKADYEKYMTLSRAYQLLYDKSTGFMCPKDDKGNFDHEPGRHPNLQTKSYTEGNPWQYLWLVPHDVNGLSALMGGDKVFSARLDSLFEASSDLGDDYTPDIAGLVGQYAHGNEPSHHIAYLYNYVGHPWKAARRLREIMYTFYGDDHMGLPGNEDVGQMSAWYVLSAVGLYQVEPCGGRYCIGSPIVNNARLNVGHGKYFDIKVNNNSAQNIYIQKATLNGKRLTKSYIEYNDIMAGGTLELTMGNKPSKFATQTANRPKSY